MKKDLTKKTDEVYGYMEEMSKKIILSGKDIDSVCYAVMFNKSDNFSMFPIPLSQTTTHQGKQVLLMAMSKILKKNKVKVKMFLLVSNATIHKQVPGGEITNDCLIISARDHADNQRFIIYEILKQDNKVVLEVFDKYDDNKEKGRKVFKDTLLDSMWKEYRKL